MRAAGNRVAVLRAPTGGRSSVVAVDDAAFKSAVDAIAKVIDGAGVLVVVGGLLLATGASALALKDRDRRSLAYRVYRQQVGKAILL